MKKDFNFREFVIRVYKESIPSIDFESAESIDCTKHRLSTSKYQEILEEMCDGDNDLLFGCNMFMLQSGPQLFDDSKSNN